MKNLHNLSIRKKFAVVIIPLVFTIVCFDFFQIRKDFLDYADAKRLNKAINVSFQVTHLLHELQRERSLSVTYMITHDEASLQELTVQRQKTDSVFKQYLAELEHTKYDDILVAHVQDIEKFNAQEKKVADLRGMVDQSSIEARKAIKYYSDINYGGLDLINMLISESRDKYAAQQVHAIIYFLEAKEYASIERALGTLIFSTEVNDPNINSEFSGLLSSQNSYTDAFLKIADDRSTAFYHNTMQGQDVEELESMRALLFEGASITIDPKFWHEVITRKINSLKEVEEFLLSEMHLYTEDLAAYAWEAFWTFLMIDMLVAGFSLALMFIVISNLLKDVATLESFTLKVAKGDLSNQVVIESKDEIGHYANTFNMMVNEINKTQEELKKERDHAEYLYENIYKQSEVVFENVGQGIFLLDSNFKISSLYSKAVERIFDNKAIANENFCNFMRPRIIQRDYEALEMFMKHLFNIELDEDVVNQLNPIEQVKIFISTNGVVITKYLRVSFTRITRANKIQTILVTISDETESVLLQQHMEESEAKKKKETEYMLNVFKVDPAALREFLIDARKHIKSISEKYENSSKAQLNDLLKYTFQVIHNIKGNAMSIGVEIITEKLHDIEDSITALRDRNVTADKFLALLYEIEEVDKMVSEMSKMLDKVGEVYKNFHANSLKDAKSQFELSLKSRLAVIAKECAKEAELVVKNPKGIALPESYLSPLQDIAIQMMRNSMAHGIETPTERTMNGKSKKGTITISIDETASDELLVSYKDDGRGLDLVQIKEKALLLGLVGSSEAGTLTEQDWINMLFQEGFSTADQVDSLSGRGQGMSLVKAIAEKHQGSLAVRYKKDAFFEVTFKFPLGKEAQVEKVA